jgi:hypothetical protein
MQFKKWVLSVCYCQLYFMNMHSYGKKLKKKTNFLIVIFSRLLVSLFQILALYSVWWILRVSCIFYEPSELPLDYLLADKIFWFFNKSSNTNTETFETLPNWNIHVVLQNKFWWSRTKRVFGLLAWFHITTTCVSALFLQIKVTLDKALDNLANLMN